jgi:hypothetical protein
MMPTGKVEEQLGVHALIAAQRRLMDSQHPFEQVVGTLWVAGTLKRRLARLTDRQIGQLLWDHVLDELTLFGPGAAICEHAVRRLFRSAGGSWNEREKSVMDEDTPPCPACGSETVYHIGIDEPDFLLCVRADSGHKESLGTSGGKEE